MMKRKQAESSPQTVKRKEYCSFCGSTVGQISERTDKMVSAVYRCPKCMRNYCDQCSYEKDSSGKRVQFCLRCDSKIEKMM